MKRPARSTYWMPPSQRQQVSRGRSKLAVLDDVMRHLLAGPLAARLSGVTVGISPMDSILVPHSTLW